MKDRKLVLLGFKGWTGKIRQEHFNGPINWQSLTDTAPGVYANFMVAEIKGDFQQKGVKFEGELDYLTETSVLSFIDKINDSDGYYTAEYELPLFLDLEGTWFEGTKLSNFITLSSYEHIKRLRVYGDYACDWKEDIKKIKKKLQSYFGALKNIVKIKK